ncbi:MAG: HAD family hydrolase [Lachnospiraceae bacterium]|nr:HAD family hydrolase [Lachnospiraceae bacterium]
MSIKAVLFDLDGTLLKMDQDEFVKTYFKYLAKHLAPRGYEPDKLLKVFWSGVNAMTVNTGEVTNKEAFWKVFTNAYGETSIEDKPYIDAFYKDDFNRVQEVCGFYKEAKEIITLVREKGKIPVLATNPLFPHTATENRMRWAGLEPADFAEYTTYENCHFCKPNPRYYEELLEKLNLKPEECIMVGNDMEEDMVPAEKLGMERFLLTNCLINKMDKDTSEISQGGFEELKKFLESRL